LECTTAVDNGARSAAGYAICAHRLLVKETTPMTKQDFSKLRKRLSERARHVDFPSKVNPFFAVCTDPRIVEGGKGVAGVWQILELQKVQKKDGDGTPPPPASLLNENREFGVFESGLSVEEFQLQQGVLGEVKKVSDKKRAAALTQAGEEVQKAFFHLANTGFVSELDTAYRNKVVQDLYFGDDEYKTLLKSLKKEGVFTIEDGKITIQPGKKDKLVALLKKNNAVAKLVVRSYTTATDEFLSNDADALLSIVLDEDSGVLSKLRAEDVEIKASLVQVFSGFPKYRALATAALAFYYNAAALGVKFGGEELDWVPDNLELQALKYARSVSVAALVENMALSPSPSSSSETPPSREEPAVFM